MKPHHVPACFMRLHHLPGLSLHVAFFFRLLFIVPPSRSPHVSHEAPHLSPSLPSMSLLVQRLLSSAPSPPPPRMTFVSLHILLLNELISWLAVSWSLTFLSFFVDTDSFQAGIFSQLRIFFF